MNFNDFERAAAEVYETIPAHFRDGVDGLEVTRATVPHPSLPDIYTLGECITDTFPTEFGGPGQVRSVVALYYGSFLALSRLDDEWDWEVEIYDTITHELQHHLETLANDESLEELDYAEDQNFARREGEPFEPYFFRSGVRTDGGGWEVDGDVFVEVSVGSRELRAGSVRFDWAGETHDVAVDERLVDVRFERMSERPGGGEVVAVLVRRRGPIEWLMSVLGPGGRASGSRPLPNGDGPG
ncbi:MAG: metallopeptidase family protein [Gemmatimonadetes bacterium]|nr:metallopeptidase family protein [Gemmatimonadota bacterium]